MTESTPDNSTNQNAVHNKKVEHSIKIEKLWFNSRQCLFKIYLNKTKQYLLLNYSGKTNYSLSLSKPSDFTENQELSLQMRKALKGCRLLGLYKSSELKKKFWLTLSRRTSETDSTSYLFRLEVDPHLHQANLMDLEKSSSLLRCMKSKVYTKIWQIRETIEPQKPEQNILNTLIEERLDPSHATHDIEDKSLTRKNWIKKLKRRRKTLTKSIIKHSLSEFDQPDNIRVQLEKLYEEMNSTSDPSLAKEIGQRVNDLHLKLKKKSLSKDMSGQMTEKINKQIHFMNDWIEKIERGEEPDFDSIKKVLGIDLISPEDQIKSKSKSFQSKYLKHSRAFELDQNWIVFVSKSAKDADALLKMSPSNATVLHVANNRGGFGVIIGKNNRKPQDDLIVQGSAMLCLHFSKQRDNLGGEVYLTKRAHLKKTKGLAPGKWILERASTIIIRYDHEKIRSLLAQRV